LLVTKGSTRGVRVPLAEPAPRLARRKTCVVIPYLLENLFKVEFSRRLAGLIESRSDSRTLPAGGDSESTYAISFSFSYFSVESLCVALLI
jgi:hypothetical protein